MCKKKLDNWVVIGVYQGDEAWRVVFRHKSWTVEKFVVVKLFINNPAYTVKFWSGSLQKTATKWSTIKVTSYPDTVIPHAYSALIEVLNWSH